ncbi:MAG: hypothetical protein M3340_09600 [Actinomycetota bacterium]|nr:hypothetical protein [Actinomycetota bacterium]
MPGGIFCIENWSADLRSQDSVAPLLDFLDAHRGARVIRQRVLTATELELYLGRFSELKSYQVAYLALHGQRGKVFVGNEDIELERLVSRSNGANGAAAAPIDLSGKVLYLGSCGSLSVTRNRIRALRERTGAAAICGYTKHVDWYEAAAVEVMLLSTLAEAMNGSKGPSLASAIRRLRRRGGTLVEDTLGFVCEPDWRPS